MLYRLLLVNCILSLCGCQAVPLPTCPQPSVSLIPDITSPRFDLIDLAPRRNADRARVALEIWQQTCPQTRQMDVPRSRYDNYACLIPGLRDMRIVIGAHHDKIGAGRGTADNWSGLLIAYHLMQYFQQHKPRYTLDFVAFAAEEPGMFGAAAYLDRMDETTIAAMINIDTIGLRSLLIDKKSAEHLSCLTQAISELLGYEYDFSDWSMLTGDGQPFLDRDIPVLNIHSVDRRTIRQIHSRRDRAGNVDRRLLDEAYRLLLNVIANLP